MADFLDGGLGSWCPQCGENVNVDEDGLCVACGATAVGDGADMAILTRRDLKTVADALMESDATITALRARVSELESQSLVCPACGESMNASQADTVRELTERALKAERVAELERERDEWKRVAELEKQLDAEKKQSAFFDLQAQRIMIQRDAEKSRAIAAEERVRRLEGAARTLLPLVAAAADALRDATGDTTLSAEMDFCDLREATDAMRAALAASKSNPRCVCVGAECHHLTGGPCACGCQTPWDESQDDEALASGSGEVSHD